ncbi:MAG: hypothetical protein JRI23_25650, partial [Deltaproteobacteria bacterium]|nr:hypothetical protein [Deltaproteobacteria bacterium]MBW2535413.1 hypothetical protein [Deltaproteobacteria bacterium]
MLDPDIRFDGFTHADWRRLLELGMPPAAPRDGEGSAAPRPSWLHDGLVAVRRAGRVVKLVHTGEGRRPVGPQDHAVAGRAEALAELHRTRWAMRIDAGALERIMDALGERGRQSDGFGEQLAILLAAGHGELLRGALDVAWIGPRGRWLATALGRLLRTAAAGA